MAKDITVGKPITLLDTQHTPNASNAYVTFNGNITLNSQSVANNTSNVTLQYTLSTGKYISWGTTTNSSGKIYTSPDNATFTQRASGNVESSSKNTTYTICEWTGNIPHNADGTLSLFIKFEWKRGSGGSSAHQPYNSTMTEEINFPSIPRQSKISVSPQLLTDETGGFEIEVDRNVSTYRHIVDWRLNRTGSYQTALIPKTSTATTATLSFATVLSKMGTATSAEVQFRCRTYENGSSTTQLGTTTYCYATILTGLVPLSLFDDKNGGVGVGICGAPIDRAGLFYKGDEYAPVTVTIGSTTYTILAKV